MKKQLLTILVIMVLGLVFLAFKQASRVDLKINRAKNELLTETGSVVPFLRESNVMVKKQTPTDQPKDKGVGPVKELKLGPVNQKLSNDGKDLFTAKCTVCHSLDQKIIGPPLKNEIKNRAPEFIMNMILNPTGMEKTDPIIKELHKKYIATPMTDQGFTQEQARSLLEYLRTVAK
jgi:hypothetical protein